MDYIEAKQVAVEAYHAERTDAENRAAWIVRTIKAATLVLSGMLVLIAPVSSSNAEVGMYLGLLLILTGVVMFLIKPYK
jgi:uncharacterized membrane protein HdeD (DUF308 family)